MENRPKFFSYRHLLSAASFLTGIYDPSRVLVVQPDFEQILVFNAMRGGDVGVLRYENDGDTLRLA